MKKKTQEDIMAAIEPIRHEFLSKDVFLSQVFETCKSQPVIILTEGIKNFLSQTIIRFSGDSGEHTGYSHVIIAYKNTITIVGGCATKNTIVAHQAFPLLRTDNLTKWLDGSYRLKAWAIDTGSFKQWRAINWIEKQVNAPVWKRTYDLLGIFGHLVKLPVIQAPWRRYCSELGWQTAKHIAVGLRPPGNHVSPNDINRLFKGDAIFPTWATPYVLGRYDPDIPMRKKSIIPQKERATYYAQTHTTDYTKWKREEDDIK